MLEGIHHQSDSHLRAAIIIISPAIQSAPKHTPSNKGMTSVDNWNAFFKFDASRRG